MGGLGFATIYVNHPQQANQAVSRRGHSIRITIHKASSSEIYENHRAGALSWNPQGGGTELESMGRGH